MLILKSVDDLLEHIRDVQESVIELSTDSLMKMSNFIEKNHLEIDEEISTSLQYQDIITQQLNASIEAINSMRKSIDIFLHAQKSDENLANDSLKKLQVKFTATLKEAKEKRSRFSGKSAQNSSDSDEIEFF